MSLVWSPSASELVVYAVGSGMEHHWRWAVRQRERVLYGHSSLDSGDVVVCLAR